MSFARYLLTASMVLSCSLVSAQAWEMPKIWMDVRYDHQEDGFWDGTNLRTDYWAFTHKKQDRISGTKWRVFTNKSGVRLLDQPGGAEVKNLGFSEILWVYDEKEDNLRVGNETQPMGWVRKQDLVLWKTPLRARESGIEIKAFAVNTARAAQQIRKGEQKDKLDVYDSPQGGTKVTTRPLYDVLFVFQYQAGSGSNDGRYLVSDHSELNSASKLTGWVSENRLKLWSTNLCLEPNWDDAAIKERREKRVYAHLFPSEKTETNERRDAYFGGGGNDRGALFTEPRDPAYEEPTIGWRSRLEGSLFRYPVFGGRKRDDDNGVFFTGAPTKLTIDNVNLMEEKSASDFYRRIQKEYEALSKSMKNLNVVFVLEAGPGPRVDRVRAMIKALIQDDTDNRLSLGAVVYYNDDVNKPDMKESDYIQAFKPEHRGGKLIEWLGMRGMDPLGDLVKTRPAYRALMRAMEMARQGETNVIVHLCGAPDHSEDEFSNDARPGYMDDGALMRAVNNSQNVHYLAYVLPSDVAERTYAQLKERTMRNMDSGMRLKYGSMVAFFQTSEGIAAGRVSDNLVEGQRIASVAPSATKLQARLIMQGVDIAPQVLKDVRESTKATEDLSRLMDVILNDGAESAAQADAASKEAAMALIDQLCESLGKGSSVSNLDCAEYAQKNKVHYFMDATTVYRATGMRQPIYRYVVFISERDLAIQVRRLSKLVSDMDGATNAADNKKSIEEYWKESARNVLGKVDERLELREVHERMLGIAQMDIVLPFKVDMIYGDLKVGDLATSRFTQEMVVKMKERYGKQLTALREVEGNTEMQYRLTDNKGNYYWVPVEYLLN